MAKQSSKKEQPDTTAKNSSTKKEHLTPNRAAPNIPTDQWLKNISASISQLKTLDSVVANVGKSAQQSAKQLQNLGNASLTSSKQYTGTLKDSLLELSQLAQAGQGMGKPTFRVNFYKAPSYKTA